MQQCCPQPTDFMGDCKLSAPTVTRGEATGSSTPTLLLAELQAQWAVDRDPRLWGALLVDLLSFVDDIVRGNPAPHVTAEQGAHALALLEVLHGRLLDVQLQRTVCPSAVRSADGILHADQGVFPLLQECPIVALDEALAPIDLASLGVADYWMCAECGRPSSDLFHDHMQQRHSVRAASAPPPLCMDDVTRCLDRAASPFPACTLYSMETPLYKCLNRAMREWDRHPAAFQPWQDFAALLDFELQQIECHTGSAFRAIDFPVPATLYQKGAVVTWNQPSSASTSPRVAKLFLQGGLGTKPSGTLFILQCHTARLVSSYSLHPEEREVLFRAGTQFQVVGRANEGLKNLLEETMWCTLQSVEVYELRELTLDSWRDLPSFLEHNDQLRNQELLDLIKSLPTHWGTCQRKTKLMCAPMTSLICREYDQATALHLAAAVPYNVACVHLVCARLQADHFTRRNADGLTALQVAVAVGHWECVVYLLHRGAPLTELTPEDLHRGMPWVCRLASVPLLTAVCAALAGGGRLGEVTLQAGLSVACHYRSREVVELFVAAGVHVNALEPEQTHEPPLVACASGGRLENLQLLLEHGANVDRDGGWALYSAAGSGHLDLVQGLLAARANVHSAHAGDGRTALMAASLMGHPTVIAALLAAGDDVHATDDALKSAIMLAAQNDHVTVIEMLLEANADVQAMDSDGRTALMYAAQGGHVAATRALLRAGAAVDAMAPEDHGRTALMYAAQAGALPVLQTLLEARADLEAATAEGHTPLMFAARRGHVGVVQALLRAKADPYARDAKGRTAAIVAAQQGHWAALRVLQGVAEGCQSPSHMPRSECSSFNSGQAGTSVRNSSGSPRRLLLALPQFRWPTDAEGFGRLPGGCDLTSESGIGSGTTSRQITRTVSETLKDVPSELYVGDLPLTELPEIRVDLPAGDRLPSPAESPAAVAWARVFGSATPRRQRPKPVQADGEDNSGSTTSSPASLAHSEYSHREQWEERRTSIDFDDRIRRLFATQEEPVVASARSLPSCPERPESSRAGAAPQSPPQGRAGPAPGREVMTVEEVYGPPSLWFCGTKALGHGPLRDAHLGTSLGGLLVAVKHLEVDPEAAGPLAGELERLCALRHPNVLRCLGFRLDPPHLALVFPYTPSCLAHVLTHIGRLPVEVVRLLARDIVRGLQYLHRHNLPHLCLRPDTVLLTPGACQLLWAPAALRLFASASAPQYLAPEAVRGSPGREADVWSLGATAWYMLLGRPLVETTNELAELFQATATCGVRYIPAQVPPDAQAFLQACLCLDPALRATPDELLATPFLLPAEATPLGWPEAH
eukprot:EG_transcript_608